jgi:Fe-S-cluster-containing dehydrogenase component
MVVDLSKCTACYCCFTACKDEYWENDYPPYSAGQPRFGQFWMNVFKKERGEYPFIKVAYMPMLCQHCGSAPCMKAARDGAIMRKAASSSIPEGGRPRRS